MESTKSQEKIHEPVLVKQVLDFLAPLKNARIIDATLGSAGHSLELAKAGANVLGIEADSQMLEVALRRLEEACPSPNRDGWGTFKVVRGNFRNIDSIAQKENFNEVDGILFDLGVSNPQLTSPTRGFSFATPASELDMRVDPEAQAPKASDLLNVLRKDQLETLFGTVLKPGAALWLAGKVVKAREESPIRSVGDFLRVCAGLRTKGTLHPATLPFLALRIAVNSELENLKEALGKAFKLLRKGGKILVITFHSAEEAVTLDFFHQAKRRGEGRLLTEKPTVPAQEEIDRNPRARSAELWTIEKI